jgi:hypothetical protein
VISHVSALKTLFLISNCVSFQIREEPPSYSTSVLQKRESFDNLHAGVGVEVLDHTRILIRVPVSGILNPGKHCMTSQGGDDEVHRVQFLAKSYLSEVQCIKFDGASVIRKTIISYSGVIICFLKLN